MKKMGETLTTRERSIDEGIYCGGLKWRSVLKAKTESEEQGLFLNRFHTTLSLLGWFNEVNLSRRHFPEPGYNRPIG